MPSPAIAAIGIAPTTPGGRQAVVWYARHTFGTSGRSRRVAKSLRWRASGSVTEEKVIPELEACKLRVLEVLRSSDRWARSTWSALKGTLEEF